MTLKMVVQNGVMRKAVVGFDQSDEVDENVLGQLMLMDDMVRMYSKRWWIEMGIHLSHMEQYYNERGCGCYYYYCYYYYHNDVMMIIMMMIIMISIMVVFFFFFIKWSVLIII